MNPSESEEKAKNHESAPGHGMDWLSGGGAMGGTGSYLENPPMVLDRHG
ncbi:hypothetical protein [Melittangium boletus]|nr:hypothetical protein [Melittangium boletus]